MVGGTARLSILAVLTVMAATVAQSKLLLNGTDCKLREPLYNVTFDFNALSSDLNHHVTSEDGGERFFFNVCDQPSGNGTTEPQAYLVRGTRKITLGYAAHLQLDDGRLQFAFVGEPCGGGGGHYTLDIVLLCGYERTPADLRVIPHTPDQCRYFIFWDTALACQPLPAPFESNRCSVTEPAGGHVYDLMGLAGSNHEVPLPDGARFVVSVCKPVRYGHLTMCPPGTGVCLVNGTDYVDFGQAVPAPSLDSTGTLVMELRSKSAQCQNSRIVFECGKEEGAGESGPVYRGRRDNCTHEFVWRTPLACRDTRPCTVSNPITGTRYDLGLLANRTYALTARDNRTYEVGVCRIPASSRCPLDAGACEVTGTQSVGLGEVSSELRYETTGAPYLLYRSGAVCDATTNRRWETKLEFICETDPVEGGRAGKVVPPTVVENGDCQLVVHFETVLVCEPALMACGAYNESTIDQYVDLTPLMDAERNYEARVATTGGPQPDRRYFLNVCRPLVPQYGLSCRGGAAACEATFDGVTARNETTLGFPDVSLVVAGSTVLMKYLRGDPCPKDPATNLSTTVEFRCSRTVGRGVPVLVEIEHDCHYRFEWETAVLCPSESSLTHVPGNCSFQNPSTGGWYDGKPTLEQLNLCSRAPTAATVDYRTGTFNLQYTTVGDANCTGTKGMRTYNVSVSCGATETPLDRTEPTKCFEVLKRQTPAVCALVGHSAVPSTPAPSPPDAVSSTEASTVVDAPTTETIGKHVQPAGTGPGPFGIVLICLTVLSTLTGGTWYLVRRHPAQCRQISSVLLCRGLLNKDDYPSTLYSRVDNSETSSLLLNPANVMSDSDDDMLI